MRLLPVIALLVASPVSASQIQYTFTGTMSFGSTLTRADGTVLSLTEAAFTVTGETIGVSPDWKPNPTREATLSFAATSVYDFGAYGSFATDAGADQYLEIYRPDSPAGLAGELALWEVGLATWRTGSIDGPYGFVTLVGDTTVVIPKIPLNPEPTAFGAFTPGKTASAAYDRVLVNSAGDTLVFRPPPTIQPNVVITSGRIDAAPEPASLALLALGVVLWARHRRQAP